jgi:hypothetical protein
MSKENTLPSGVKLDDLAQLIAESMPGWNTEADYEENRVWLTKQSRYAEEQTEEEFEAALKHVNSRLDRVNAAALDAAKSYVTAISEKLEEAEQELAKTAWDEGRTAVIKHGSKHVQNDEPLEGFIDQHAIAVGGSKLVNPYA